MCDVGFCGEFDREESGCGGGDAEVAEGLRYLHRTKMVCCELFWLRI